MCGQHVSRDMQNGNYAVHVNNEGTNKSPEPSLLAQAICKLRKGLRQRAGDLGSTSSCMCAPGLCAL